MTGASVVAGLVVYGLGSTVIDGLRDTHYYPRRRCVVYESEMDMFEQELVEHPVRSRVGWGIGFLVSAVFWILLIGGLLYGCTTR